MTYMIKVRVKYRIFIRLSALRERMKQVVVSPKPEETTISYKHTNAKIVLT